MIMSMSNGKYIDVLQNTTAESLDSLNFANFESASTCATSNHHHQSLRLVQAAEQIEPQTSSKPFNFDIFRLMSILYSQSISQSAEKSHVKISKPLKIQIINGYLQCASDPSGWIYRVRLAANCFEQNLIAVPLNGIDSDFFTNNFLSSTVTSSHSRHSVRVVLRATRPIASGEELAFWPSFDLNLALDIPFLSPSNIINGTCYICTSCGKCYTQPNPLKIHLKFACPVAASTNSFSCQSFNNSLSSHSSNFSASHLKKSSSQYLLTTVAASTNGNSNYTEKLCRLNGMNTNSQTHLSSLVKPFNQHSVRPTKKSIKSNQKHNLDGHRKLHSCTYCGKVYTRKYGLKIHIRTHTGLKPLNCRFCGRSFSDPSNLNKHVRLHTQQVPASSNKVNV